MKHPFYYVDTFKLNKFVFVVNSKLFFENQRLPLFVILFAEKSKSETLNGKKTKMVFNYRKNGRSHTLGKLSYYVHDSNSERIFHKTSQC